MDTIFPACNTLEDDRFESIAEFKDCIGRGDEIEFEWKGVHFGMSGCQPKPEHRIMAYLWNQPDNNTLIRRTTRWNTSLPETACAISSHR